MFRLERRLARFRMVHGRRTVLVTENFRQVGDFSPLLPFFLPLLSSSVMKVTCKYGVVRVCGRAGGVLRQHLATR